MLDPRHPGWGSPSLPTWVTGWREHQVAAVEEVVALFEAGVKVVFLDGPTGAGKTLIAEAVRRRLHARALYVCSTKTLQDQFAEDFDYAAVLKGRANYRTLDDVDGSEFNGRFGGRNAGDCTGERTELPACEDCPVDTDGHSIFDSTDEEGAWHCNWCHPTILCPYNVAKRCALASELAVVNTAYLLAEGNSAGKFSARELIIADEADLLEAELMRYIEVAINAKWRQKLGLDGPDRRKRGIDSWRDWIEKEALPAIDIERAKVSNRKSEQAVRDTKVLNQLRSRLRSIRDTIDDGNWVYSGRGDEITFRPVRVSDDGHDVLWKHSRRWLCMSATLIDPAEMALSLGIPDEWAWQVVRCPMTFPVDRRRIHVIPAADMTKKNEEAERPKMAAVIDTVLAKHPNERVLIHTVSYSLAQYLYDNLAASDRCLLYRSSSERAEVLEKYRAQEGAVLLAPSFDRGVDLPHDLCRVVVVAKVPFPNLGDPQVKARLYSHGGQTWYSVQVVRSLVQMTGRGMRSADDWCATYILDRQFVSNVWGKSRSLIPRWWTEALDWTGQALKPTPTDSGATESPTNRTRESTHA